MATRVEILNKLDIKPGEWVLEIGGGPAPFARSDILADKYLDKNIERSGALVVDRPVVICDACYLPFLDHSFDYVFCSQTLEHLENPRLFFKEIARVGRKGYIETPNEIRERLFGWPFHKWVVAKDARGLILRQNDVEQAFGLFFHKLQLENYEFARFCATSHDLLNICYEWQGEPNYQFLDTKEPKLPSKKVCLGDSSQFILSEPYGRKLNLLRRLKKRIPRQLKESIKNMISPPPYGYRHSDKKTKTYLREILACPVCKLKVNFEHKNRITCVKCGRYFEVKKGIPFLLRE